MTSFESTAHIEVFHFEHEIICSIIEEGSKVLDLGCGGGDLLQILKNKKNIQGTGVEVSESLVYECIRKGLTVHHGDINEGLADYLDQSFDYVILSDTLQEVHNPILVFKEMLRVGRKGIVSFPNFGYWRARSQLFFLGQAPVTKTLPHSWYETPNIHFFTIKDFFHFCEQEQFQIAQSYFLKKNRQIRFMPNLRAELALCVIA